MKVFIRLIFFVLCCIEPFITNPCFNKLKCNECLTTSSVCAWCMDKDFNKYKSRCELEKNLQTNGCKKIFNPQDYVNFLSNESVSETNSIQIRPQKVNVGVRKGSYVSFDLEFRYHSSFPVDFYVLMDMSYSMLDDLLSMKTLSNEIATGLGKITKKYKLGIGSFVDKVVAPYATDEKSCNECEPAFGFRNVLSLTEDVNSFIERINSMKISGNVDFPEGTFDAIMQAAVCEKELNWTNKNLARKIIFLLTDGSFKIAGDGKLAGIITPNDGLCHLDEKMEYSESSNQDYPSVFSVKEKLMNNRISVILAVNESVLDLYTSLADTWKEVNAKVAILKPDASNILDLVNRTMREIASTVTIFHNAPENIQIDIESNCNQTDYIKGHQCTSVNVDQSVNFRVTIKVLSCLTEPIKFNIIVAGLAEMEVSVNNSCNCECHNKIHTDYEQNSPYCSSNGDLVCGICQCNSGRTGELCQCDIKTEFADSSANDACIDPKGSKDVVCNGHGDCVCGSCICHRRVLQESPVHGKYCECTEKFCPLINDEKCGGSKRGFCDCNNCVCNPMYSGDYCTNKNCSNPEWNNECIDTKENVCGNHGYCACGICTCDSGYEGQYCERLSLTCQHVESCTKCIAALENNDFKNCENHCIKEIQISFNDFDIEQGPNPCVFRDQTSGCEVRSLLMRNQSTSEISLFVKKINKNTDCPRVVNALIIGFSITGSIVLAGIILIALWIIANKIYERRLFNQFEREKALSRWQKNENPLYKSNISGYKNPLYRTTAVRT